jgi:uncharacterized lipoprotein YbaY
MKWFLPGMGTLVVSLLLAAHELFRAETAAKPAGFQPFLFPLQFAPFACFYEAQTICLHAQISQQPVDFYEFGLKK